MSETSIIQRFRKAIWHFRSGGSAQLRHHLRKNRSTATNPKSLTLKPHEDSTRIPEWKVPQPERKKLNLTVAVILDEFSTLAWQYEWDQIPITPKNWRDVFTQKSIQMLFVESAWNGNGGAWLYHLTGPSAPRPALVELLRFCRDNNIPTIFWNKEDPTHYSDFIDTARLFDYVFTTDSNKVEEYRNELKHNRVDVLPFAAQPAIHNPIRPMRGRHTKDIAFAGTYFTHRHAARRAQMDLLLGAATEVATRTSHSLAIYSRFMGEDSRYQFPAPFAEYVTGTLSYERMLSAYRLHKVFLNVNTVTDSPSMCARRIFEISASGTPVISTPSQSISRIFGEDAVWQAENSVEAAFMMRTLVKNQELRDRTSHLAQRTIWAGHTYQHRANQILTQAGLGTYVKSSPTVSILISTNRPHQVKHVLAMAQAQENVEAEIIILTHGFELSAYEKNSLKDQRTRYNINFMSAEEDRTLGDCLNKLLDASSGDYIAKFDDDDIYFPNYLFDQIQSFNYSNADVVGKHAHYMYSADIDRIMLRNSDKEHRYSDFIAGPTIVAASQIAKEIRFESRTTGEDTSFLQAVSDMGGKIYSADRFNFVQYRRASEFATDDPHTWKVSTWELLANSQIEVNGWFPEHVEI